MRSSSDFDRNTYPFKVDFTGGIAYNVIDQRTQETTFKGVAGEGPLAATTHADAGNKAYWAKVDAGLLQTA